MKDRFQISIDNIVHYLDVIDIMSCLVKNMLNKFITFGGIFSVVVDNSVDSFLNV